jgi:hypothetical protein
VTRAARDIMAERALDDLIRRLDRASRRLDGVLLFGDGPEDDDAVELIECALTALGEAIGYLDDLRDQRLAMTA